MTVVQPIHKKDCKMEKSTYKPMSILPNLSKIHKQLLYGQVFTFFSNFFFHCECSFRMGYSFFFFLFFFYSLFYVDTKFLLYKFTNSTMKLENSEITTKYTLRSLLISQKRLIVFCIIFLLQSYILIVLILSPRELSIHI